MAQKKVKLTAGVKVGDKWYKPGEVFEGDADLVSQLIRDGAARDPKADEATAVDTSAAEVKAQAIVEEAEKTLADAKAEAEKIVNGAKAEAEKIRAEAKPAEAETSVAKQAAPKK